MDTSPILILISAALINNFVLTRFLGICPFIGVSRQLEGAVGMTGAVIFVLALASALSWGIDQAILVPFNLPYLRTFFFILIIAALVQLLEMILKKFSPVLQKMLGVYLPLITTNCIVLGVALLNIDLKYNLLQSVTYGIGAGTGFGLALILMAGIRERLETADIPIIFRGVPISFITAALMSIAFMGFAGLRL
jgi:electron transport complex protein RnfA